MESFVIKPPNISKEIVGIVLNNSLSLFEILDFHNPLFNESHLVLLPKSKGQIQRNKVIYQQTTFT